MRTPITYYGGKKKMAINKRKKKEILVYNYSLNKQTTLFT